MSGLLPQLAQYFFSQEGQALCLYGDFRFPNKGSRRKNCRIGCTPDSVNLAMSVVMKDIQEQSMTTMRMRCHEIKFSKEI